MAARHSNSWQWLSVSGAVQDHEDIMIGQA